MMADNKEQRVCVKFCFLLGKSAAETVLMLQEAFKDFFLLPRMKGQMKRKRFADVSEVKKKTLEVLNNTSTEELQKCSSSEKNVGKSVLSQKESTLKETRFVIVQNLINHLKKNNSGYFWVPPSYIRRESNSQWKKTCRYSR